MSATTGKRSRQDGGQLATEGTTKAKKSSTSTESAEEAHAVVDNLLIQLQDDQGNVSGPQMDVPADITPSQLQNLLFEIVPDVEKTRPYAFFVNDSEIGDSLRQTAQELGLSTEHVMKVKYQPLSQFRVRPVTRCTASLPGHSDAILHVHFSPDGKYLASGGGDAVVRFWDVYTTTPKFVCKGHASHVLCTAFSPDGKYFASADKTGQVRVWSPDTGTEVCSTLRGHKKWVTSLSWEPLHVKGYCERLASSSKDHTVRIWNVRTGNFEFSLTGHSDSIECVKWGGSGLIYTASRDRTILVWSVKENKPKLIRTLKGHAHRINTLALNTEFAMRKISENPPGDGEDLSSLAQKTYSEAREDTGEVLVSGSDDCTLFMWHPETSSKPISRLTGHQQPVNHLVFSPDRRFLASASFDKKIKIWNGKNGKLLATLHGHVGAVYQVAWAPDSRFIASGSKDSTVKVWEVGPKASTKALHTLPGHADEVFALDWSPSGSHVASGSKDRILKIWAH